MRSDHVLEHAVLKRYFVKHK